MATTTFEAELASNNPANIFKALGGIIFAADIATSVPSAFTTASTSDLLALPTPAWWKLGLLTKADGLKFTRDQTKDTDESWGYNEPTRTDIIQDAESAAFTMQETTRRTLEMIDMVDLSAVTPDATTGEITYNKPLISVSPYRRLIYLGVDGAGTARRYRIKVMPRAQVSTPGEINWVQGTAVRYGVTILATVDPTLGYSVRNVLAGPGQKTLNATAWA